MNIDAKGMHFAELDRLVKGCKDNDITIDNVLGQRYIAAGAGGKHITINGIPGNALGAYMDGCRVDVYGNAQDAVGDTMSDGVLVIRGNCGDTAGYGMRGGRIFIEGSAGWRVGIHMKEYGDSVPAIVIGGSAGSYLGEYLAGGRIVVLGIGFENSRCVGDFTSTGMHGGRIYVRSRFVPADLPAQTDVSAADDKSELEPLVREYCSYFGGDADKLLADDYYVLSPSTACIYNRMYTNRPF